MTTMSRFLALIPVVAFAAGCNGTAPSGPSQVSNNDTIESASGDASAMGRTRCTLYAIDLDIRNSDDTMLWVDATYRSSPNQLSTPCAAPVWTSDREGLTVAKENPYRAGFARFLGGVATLKVSGPNGVHNSIQLDLSTNTRPGHGAPVPGTCENVAKVSLSFVPTSDNATVALVASYTYDGPVSSGCGIAPDWQADRIGLTVNKADPFKASIGRSSEATTTVTATAPNGAVGSTTF